MNGWEIYLAGMPIGATALLVETAITDGRPKLSDCIAAVALSVVWPYLVVHCLAALIGWLAGGRR